MVAEPGPCSSLRKIERFMRKADLTTLPCPRPDMQASCERDRIARRLTRIRPCEAGCCGPPVVGKVKSATFAIRPAPTLWQCQVSPSRSPPHVVSAIFCWCEIHRRHRRFEYADRDAARDRQRHSLSRRDAGEAVDAAALPASARCPDPVHALGGARLRVAAA